MIPRLRRAKLRVEAVAVGVHGCLDLVNSPISLRLRPASNETDGLVAYCDFPTP